MLVDNDGAVLGSGSSYEALAKYRPMKLVVLPFLLLVSSIHAWVTVVGRQNLSLKLRAVSSYQRMPYSDDETETEERLRLMWTQAPFRTIEKLVNGTILGSGSTGLRQKSPSNPFSYDDTLFAPLFKQSDLSIEGTAEEPVAVESLVQNKQNKRKNFALTVAYRGSSFCGWQTQVDNSLPSVQQSLEEHLVLLEKERDRVDVRVCGRTDSGVHAIGQVCRYRTFMNVDRDDVQRHLETLPLADSLRCLKVTPVSDKFHPSFGSTCRAYVYVIDAGFITESEVEKLNNLLQELENKTLDFVAVSYGKIKTQSTDCTLFCARAFALDEEDGGGVCIQLVGNRFLRRMVRILVSTALLWVFDGKTSLLDLLEAKDRSLSARPASPGGLMFVGADFETM